MAGLLQLGDTYDPVKNVQQWQLEQSAVQHELDDATPIGHDDIAQLSKAVRVLFQEIAKAVSAQPEISHDIKISLERSHSSLVLWSDGYGASEGTLDKTLAKSRKLRNLTLRSLAHVGSILIESKDRWIHASRLDIFLMPYRAHSFDSNLVRNAARALFDHESIGRWSYQPRKRRGLPRQ